ncbi:hypothetical protein K1719_042790 [Acacia pycnantha]|nr:hypothetical protein K1719_042790 [Acacia pycnantha]
MVGNLEFQREQLREMKIGIKMKFAVGFANDLTFDASRNASKPKSSFILEEQDFYDNNSVHGSPVNVDEKKGNSTINGDCALESESTYVHSE